MHITTKAGSAIAAMLAASLLAAGCGSSSSSSTASTASSGTSAPAATTADSSSGATGGSAAGLGTPKKASGKPVVLGLINLEAGPVTFPEYRQAAEAAVKYINDYKGGIGGRPVQLASCASDGQPATSARCANQIADKNPTAILGGADTGAPGAFPVWKRKNLAVLGGIPFTPVESNAPNAVQFISVSIGDNLAAAKYVVDQFHPKKSVVIYTDDSQGKAVGLGVIAPSLKAQGVDVSTIPVAPSTSDLTSVAAAAVQKQADLIYVNTPNACPQILKALKSVGNTAKLAGIELCTSPPALKAAGDAAEGIYVADPFDSLDSGTPDTGLMMAAVQKYGDKNLALDSIAQSGFSSVLDVQAALDPVKDLTTKSILAAVKGGSDHPNFMAHPYTCDGKQLPGSTSSCNAYQRIKQVKDGKVVAASQDWVSGADNYTPAKG
jgi:branched-chain amino acid transport system substrate-binding protein